MATLLETATKLCFYPATKVRVDQSRPGEESDVQVGEKLVIVLPTPVREVGLIGFIDMLAMWGTDVLLCGGLTCGDLETLRKKGIRVEPWIGGAVDEVLNAWFSGRIQSVKMPGCAGCRGKQKRYGSEYNHKEGAEMKSEVVAVTSEGPLLEDMVDPRFGRAAGFVIMDLTKNEARYIDNGGSQTLAQGAGIQAAENVAQAGADLVISGFVGPKAFQALSAAGIRIIQNVEGVTVAQALDKYRRGELKVADAPNSRGHGNTGGKRQGAGGAR
ncbi:NifB/NifX family molybdenum-iron cluster-binding protein [Desulfonatronum thiosulfatophilum]|uniref:NifB/NifX family molybdenum-iron cluster-binding protein n=1 Tax=Desulfonatronum thiosulfatophilum TaxID=617002 RepID=UPI001FC95D22|nr:NifB/NifX family molybdenum-iron cluster-binding protein [Desulfonatronum thiosulfatophilum]